VGHPIPTDDSPSGVVLELGAPQLFAFLKRQFDCLSIVPYEVAEELLVPIPGTPKPWGVLWVMSHERGPHFDSEHRRILTSLANFTCAALTITQAKADVETRAEEAEAARNALARRQVKQLKRLVRDLLDASRVRHGKLSVQPAYCLLGDIIDDAMAAVRDEAERRGHLMPTFVPSYPVTVFADAARLTQVLSNLLWNAVKYTPPGGEITLRVGAPDPGAIPEGDSTRREAVVSIHDNGVGIAADLLPHVFDLFSQSPSARMRAEGGLGLGLSVVKYLVDAHRGEVEIFSQGEGKGTEVMLRLPIVCRRNVEASAPTLHSIARSRILLVDDCTDATEALSMLLTLEGHEVKCAQNGQEALSLVDSFRPDVALIDIQMPGMDGHELARRLRQRKPCASTRLVALTGYAGTTDAIAVDNAFDCYLIKPPSLEDLASVLRQ
jgi:CheY-like chemotaxis protein